MIRTGRPTRRVIAAIVAAATVFALTACAETNDTKPTAAPTSSAVATAQPMFATDEEALAAASAVYAEYLAMSDLIYSEGGANPERMDPLASGSALDEFYASANKFESKKIRTIGITKFWTVSIQASQRLGEVQRVVVYLCGDVSGVDLLDEAGTSQVDPDRDPFMSYEVAFDFQNESNGTVSERKPWDGKSFC